MLRVATLLMIVRHLALAAAFACFATRAHAAKNLGFDVECDTLKLEAASGVPNKPQHAYRFAGSCRLVQKGEVGGDFTSHTVLTFPVLALARWDQGKHELREDIEVPAGVQWQGKSAGGQVSSIYSCNDDPVIRSATCVGKAHDNETTISELTEHYLATRPFTRGWTNAATAAALSATGSAPDDKAPGTPKQAAVPPPPKRKPPSLKSTSDIKSAPHLTVRSPKAKEVFSGATVPIEVVAPDTLIHNYGAGMALFDWEMAADGGRWSRVDMLSQMKWTERDGHIFVAAIDVPVSRFTRSVRWRMRARADHQAVAPTAWVEFSVVPVGQ